ncbi:hypothetical protein D9C73_011766 [Collichthys lucidus]|uniref:Uncharacterized protein n=1 Tax=Collichthys lucidus TaxID=240159 RepID=A0A4U5UVD5_COLLU|nr:hypothetical protein D9C73_011766 [Collichthys lucidus]
MASYQTIRLPSDSLSRWRFHLSPLPGWACAGVRMQERSGLIDLGSDGPSLLHFELLVEPGTERFKSFNRKPVTKRFKSFDFKHAHSPGP